VLVRRLRTDLPVESMQGWVMVVDAPLLHAGSLAFREPQVGSIDWTVDAVVALVYLTLVVGGVGFLLYLRLLDRIGPVEVNLISYTLPVSVAAVGWVLFGERVEPNVVAGFLVVVVGFVLVKRRAMGDELGR
jgi:drug/metabolite transporter (DMT)-like permease